MFKRLQKIGLALLILGASAVAQAGTAGYQIGVNGMVCAFCAQGIDKKLKSQKEVESVDVSLEKKEVVVRFKTGSSLTQEKITELLKDAGYETTGFKNLN